MQSEKRREPRIDLSSPNYNGWVVDEKETEKLILQKGRVNQEKTSSFTLIPHPPVGLGSSLGAETKKLTS